MTCADNPCGGNEVCSDLSGGGFEFGLPGIQDGYNRKGLVSERGQRKLAFTVLQKWYQKLANGS